MRLVVTGKSGQVASALQELGGGELAVVAVGRPEMDLADSHSVDAAIEGARPDIVVSAAAYTAVDKAEAEPDLAFAVNAAGAEAVAASAARLGVPLIHLSTDYVFDGKKPEPYRETDPVNPINVYGVSKAAGEEAVRGTTANHVILRTAWVHSPFGSNFVRTILRLAQDRPLLRVVDDQHGTPTAASEIARAIVEISHRLRDEPSNADLRGTFHLASSGETTWAGFAEELLAQLRRSTGVSAAVEHIGTADYPTPAKRPANSRLATDRLAAVYGIALPDWRVGAAETLRRLTLAADKAA